MSKSAQATAAVARQLLAVAVGERIPTTSELARASGVSYGTVHSALKTLQTQGAVRLSTHGHQGTRISRRELGALWRAGHRGAMVGLLPLPLSMEFSGLATAVTTLAEKAGFPLQLTFRQAASERLALLRDERVDWVLTSALAAATESSQRSPQTSSRKPSQGVPQESSLLRESSWCDSIVLPPHTYYGRDSVVVIAASADSPSSTSRVAIDSRSYDHAMLTRVEFPDAEFVDAAYWRIPDMVAARDVDAAIWHRTSSSSLVTAASLTMHPLRAANTAITPELTSAALVFRAQDAPIRAVLTELFDVSEVTEIQRQVLSHNRPPAY